MIHAKSLTKRVPVTRIRRGMVGSLPQGLKSRYTIAKTLYLVLKSTKITTQFLKAIQAMHNHHQ
jgi:hypothetical protein